MRRDKFEDERGSAGSGGGSSWISYSDMMASLLLVFLLMLCVSLLQYFTAPKQEDLDRQTSIEERMKEADRREAELKERETALNEKEIRLNERDAQITEREKAAAAKEKELEEREAALKAAREQLEKEQEALKAAQERLEKDQQALKAAQEQLEKEQEALKAAQEQLEKDQQALQAAQEQLEQERVDLETERTLLREDRAALEIEKEQIKKDREALQAAREQLEKEQEQLRKDQEQLKKEQEQLQKEQEELKKAQEELKKAREELEKEKQALKAQQEELEQRLKELETPAPEPTPEHAADQADQQKQDALENYAVRSRIISSQFAAFSGSGLEVSIDPDSGDIVLANSILFDTGSDVLRPEGMAFLDEFVPVYLDALMKPEYEGYISEVIIEGHTDTRGTYFGNLSLSQSRASRVMQYSLSVAGLTEAQKEFLQSMASATGRGSADPVYDQDGNVDMEACRRVEFKFRMKETGILAGTGIIEELTQVLGTSGLEVSVDEDTGDIRLNSTIMFETNSAEVKAEGQEFIRKFLPIYLDVLMKPEYEAYIGVIIIEGYTDNKGTYAANLELSQQRAANVMKYCLQVELTDEQKEYLRNKITATGRSYANLIYREDGNVDMAASRRVVFKFRLKDAKSLGELMEMIPETSK